nr:7146_t:CDS:2 [Entrophospora candida]
MIKNNQLVHLLQICKLQCGINKGSNAGKRTGKNEFNGKKSQERPKLSHNITNLKHEAKYCTELLLRQKRTCNAKGALEFIRSMSQDKTISFRDPTDNVLMKLTQDATFVSFLKQTC